MVSICFISFFCSLISEGLSWLLVYRTEKFQKLKSDQKRLARKVEKNKTESQVQKKGAKKVKTCEEELQAINRSLSWERMKSDGIIFLGFILIVLSILSSMFDGKSIAKLPFEPFSLIRGMTHRGVPGNDFTDCSYIFIYVLSSVVFRTNMQKLFGTTPPPQKFFTEPK
uniref:Calcium load-activated calcium channel n=1 Tax=Arcella intermedia TaxID=1963864 RepID=A0A6B2LMB3_9EUKA